VKLSRLYQPKNPQFWLLVLLNVLSSAISWILQQQTMPMMVTVLLSVFVLANIALGLKIAVQLMNSDSHLPSRKD
jgi:Na+/melibiose symporter-like transporter